MLKNIIMTLGGVLVISACSPTKPIAFPGEFLGADYLLSEKNAEQWVKASQQAEHCIYPNLTKIQRQHFLPQDAYLHAQYVLFYPLEKIIGEEYVKMIQEDEKSMGYAKLQFQKFKDTTYKPLANGECQILQNQARDDLAVLKGEYKNGMANNNKIDENKNNEGIATNENKFFFDIIKWGAALLF